MSVLRFRETKGKCRRKVYKVCGMLDVKFVVVKAGRKS